MGAADWARRTGFGIVTPDGHVHIEDETGFREHEDMANDLGYKGIDHAVDSGAVRFTRLAGGLDIEVNSHVRGAVSRAGEFVAKHGRGKHIFVAIKDRNAPNGERNAHSPNTEVDHRELVADLMKHEDTIADRMISMVLENIQHVDEISIGGILGRVASKSKDIWSKAQETVRKNVDDFHAELRKGAAERQKRMPPPPPAPTPRRETPAPAKPAPARPTTPAPARPTTPAPARPSAPPPAPARPTTPAPARPSAPPPAPARPTTPAPKSSDNNSPDKRVTSTDGEYTFVHTPIKTLSSSETTHHKIISFDDRKIVNIKVGDTHIPFYCSTGKNPKDGVIPGRWYPMLGLTPSWINKEGGEGGMKDHYGHPELRRMSDHLNRTIGDIRDGDNPPNPEHPFLQSTPAKDGRSPQEHVKSAYDHINHTFGGTSGVYTRPHEDEVDRLNKEKGPELAAAIKNRNDTLSKNKARIVALAGQAQREREGRGSRPAK